MWVPSSVAIVRDTSRPSPVTKCRYSERQGAGLSNATAGARWELFMGLPSTRQAFVSPVRRFIDQTSFPSTTKISLLKCQPPKSGVDAPTPRRRLGSHLRRLGPSRLRQAMYDISPSQGPRSQPIPPPLSATEITANTPHSSRRSSRTATHSRSSPSPSTTHGSWGTCSGGACCPSPQQRSSRSRSPTAGRCCFRPSRGPV